MALLAVSLDLRSWVLGLGFTAVTFTAGGGGKVLAGIGVGGGGLGVVDLAR